MSPLVYMLMEMMPMFTEGLSRVTGFNLIELNGLLLEEFLLGKVQLLLDLGCGNALRAIEIHNVAIIAQTLTTVSMA